MQLIILAAGRGQRLYPLTKDTPKSLLDLGDGSTLLDRQMQLAVDSACIDKVCVVVGYCHEKIESCLDQYRSQLDIETIYNPYFDVSNALLSLWCAEHLLEQDDFCISNGDNIYRDAVFAQMVRQAGTGFTANISRKAGYDDDDMKVLLNAAGELQRIGKDVPLAQAQADSVGLFIIKGAEYRRMFRQTLLAMVKREASLRAYWQDILNGLLVRGAVIATHEIPHDAWAEIDFHPDVQAMRAAVLGKLF